MWNNIKKNLGELKEKFPLMVKFSDDFKYDYGCITITISKKCISSNMRFLQDLMCNCCKKVIHFAQYFNEKFYFLLEHNPPFDFMKLDNPNLNNRRFKVEIKHNFLNHVVL